MEGNICYQHHHPVGQWEPDYAAKRQSWQSFCHRVSAVVEIGFNAGHSAALALGSNDSVCYWGIDPGEHSYTRHCAQALKGFYPQRFHWLEGVSRAVMPEFSRPPGRVLWSIDGEHTVTAAYWDLVHCQQLAQQGDWLWFDDAEHPGFAPLIDRVLEQDRWLEIPVDDRGRWRVWHCCQ